MHDGHPFRALVVGGSVGGLAVAHELRSIGAAVPCMSDLPIGLSRAAPGSSCSPRLRRYWAALGYQYLRSASSFMNASNCTSMAKPPALRPRSG